MSACFCVGCPHTANCRCRCPECKAVPFASREELARTASWSYQREKAKDEPALPFGHLPLHKD